MTTTNTARQAFPTVITIARIKRWGACNDAIEAIRQAYPDGVPCTRAAAIELYEQGVDVLWGALRLLTKAQRVEFILFTLRQRQPHVVTLLRRAGFDAHADAIARLVLTMPAEAATATDIFAAAGAAARAAAWDAAWDAAGAAAWDAARAAAGAAARAAAGDVAWDAARDAASAAARDAASAAASAAAGAAAKAAARDAARAAAWDAATRDQIAWVADLLGLKEERPGGAS